MPLEMMEPTRKGIAITRSFGTSVTSWREMREAIASYAMRAAEKMRRYKDGMSCRERRGRYE